MDLGQADNHTPKELAPHIVLWAEICLGWLLTTLGVLGVTGIVRKDHTCGWRPIEMATSVSNDRNRATAQFARGWKTGYRRPPGRECGDSGASDEKVPELRGHAQPGHSPATICPPIASPA